MRSNTGTGPCRRLPQRLLGMAPLPATRPQAKDKEIKRCHSVSSRGQLDVLAGTRVAGSLSRTKTRLPRTVPRWTAGRAGHTVFCTVRHAARWGRMCSGSRKSGQYTRLRRPDHPRPGSNAARVRRGGERAGMATKLPQNGVGNPGRQASTDTVRSTAALSLYDAISR